MKKLTIIFIGLLFYFNSFAQPDKSCLDEEDWSCVYPAKKVYFEDRNKEVYCLRIDSTFNDNNILYPFSDLHIIDWECYSITAGSWLSKYIMLDESGNTIFINGKNQPILIKNKAALNDRWTVFENENMKVEGQITSVSLKSVLTVADSVKTISFTVYDLDDMPVNHALNQISIEVGKHFGLVKTVNFYYFEHETDDYLTHFNQFGEFNLIGIDEPQLGFQNINLREQYYDFQVGDELHILDFDRPSAPSYSYERKIIHRYISRTDYNDSIVYDYERKMSNYTREFINGTVNENTAASIDTLKQTIVKGLLFDTEPNEPYGEEGVCKAMIVNNPLTTMYFYYYPFHYDYAGCLIPAVVDACGSLPTYYPGLGGPYYSYCEIWLNESAYELVYYKKGDTEWGTPFDLKLSIPEYKKNTSFAIYPNPAINYISIKSASNPIVENSVIEIYDIQGRKHLSKPLDDSKLIDVSFLKTGYYIVKLIRKNKDVIYIKMIKQ